MPSTVFMFSGQGSQYFQMGRVLYEQHAVFAREMNEMDALLKSHASCSVLPSLYGGAPKSQTMDDILLSHPAIFMVEVALARTLMAEGVMPDLVLGASLGTMAAAVIAGQLDRDDALLSVSAQARCMVRHAAPGAMVAVLGETSLIDGLLASRKAVVAARSFDGHFVASLPVASLPELDQVLDRTEAVRQRLPVPFAFHSPWIDDVRLPFLATLDALRPERSRIGVVCCASGETRHEFVPSRFWSVAREPIDFQRTLLGLEARGPHRYVDVGPSGTLATFSKYLLGERSASQVHTVIGPFGNDDQRYARVLAALR
jgi:acyl transferase domain-containing protein